MNSVETQSGVTGLSLNTWLDACSEPLVEKTARRRRQITQIRILYGVEEDWLAGWFLPNGFGYVTGLRLPSLSTDRTPKK